jgi:3-hydroxybutyryl-CoA dehydrogenase
MPSIKHDTSGIKKVGIIGEGKMGSGLFNYLLDFNFELVWLCSQDADTEKITRQFGKRIKRSLEAGIIDQNRFDTLMQLPITQDMGGLYDCDLIIEAIPEIVALKRNLFVQLDRMIKPAAIFTSNSSSINPSEIAPPGNRRGQFAGLHFFYPVQLKNIVEVTIAPSTTISALDAIETFLETIQRRFITLEEKNSFVLNKIFLDVQNEAWLIVRAGQITLPQMDQLVKRHLFPFGVFDLCDSVGLDTMLASIRNYIKDYPHKDYFASFISVLDDLTARGKFGIKSNEGFYKYPRVEVSSELPPGSDAIAEHLRQTWISTSRRFAAQCHLPLDDMNWAIKEYFGTDTGPFG